MTLKLNGSSSGYTAIDAPASAGSNTLTLPANNGSANQYLKNSGTAGVLEFAALSAGKILQVVSATDAQKTTSSGNYEDIYDSNVAITLASTSNKVLCLHVTAYAHHSAASSQQIQTTYRMKRTTSGDTVTELNLGRMRAVSTDQNCSITLLAVDTTFSNLANNYNVELKYDNGDESANAYNNTIVLMEIGA
tara:strand:+ start:403 stop:978 length:576 start_codon:yes stop_codon:yes gene_type:complete